MKNRWVIWGILILVIPLFLVQCDKDDDPEPERNEENEILYDLMQDWYLWYDQLPEVNPNSYEDNFALLEALKYREKDRWSQIWTYDKFTAYFEEAKYIGLGFVHTFDWNGNLRILYLFDNSPLKQQGVTRGWIIKEINGQTITDGMNISTLVGPKEIGVSVNMKLEKPDGGIVDMTVSNVEIHTNSVLHYDIIEVDNKNVGHMVFERFIEPSFYELATVFSHFKSNNVDELIIDLRYNSGGILDVTTKIASYIIPESVDQKAFVKVAHNDKHTDDDEVIAVARDPQSLNLNKVYFITTKGSASASESLINGLDPYIDVYLIGSRTSGKPVGMNVFHYQGGEFVYLPITFRVENSIGHFDYFNGIPVDAEVIDDVTRDFSDLQEECLKEALYHIRNGSFSGKKSAVEMDMTTIKENPDIKSLIINR